MWWFVRGEEWEVAWSLYSQQRCCIWWEGRVWRCWCKLIDVDVLEQKTVMEVALPRVSLHVWHLREHRLELR